MTYDFLKWTGQAGFHFEEKGVTVWIDPFQIPEGSKHADLIFITHSHQDHLSPADLQKITDQKTSFVAPDETAAKLQGYRNITKVKPGEKGKNVLGISFETIAAYNVHPKKLQFHPKSNNWVGYVIETNGKRIYHAGDTDMVNEMEKVDADLALLPCGGTYTMDIDEMIEGTKKIRAKNFAPIHYRALVGKEGSDKLEKKFKEKVPNGIILQQVNTPKYSF
jgi:L-ascorbate metabolism protein UlaG (beta-lactamase superfamily)